MLEDLFFIHTQVMLTTPQEIRRYLWEHINWDAQAICLFGDRGVGKTTLMCQYLLERYPKPGSALYISADNFHVISHGLFNIAREFFAYGGVALFIDEIHKYPNWSVELKNIIDTYRQHSLIISGSSAVDLKHSKGDLSRRIVYYKVPGLSFREYLNLTLHEQFSTIALDDLWTDHLAFAQKLQILPILKHFNDYLTYGYYPFFMEGVQDYLPKLNNIIEKVIFEDLAISYRLKPTTLNTLKRIIWLIATSEGLIPNIDSMSKNLAVARESIYDALEFLDRSGLICNLYPAAQGMKLVRKPGKIYLGNTNLLCAINGNLQTRHKEGVFRETFFVNQVMQVATLKLPVTGDYLINQSITVEVGGPGKTGKQIKDLESAYLAIDGIEIGIGRKIPLYLFGFLY